MTPAKLPAGYPLAWPEGWERTKWPSKGRYEVSFADARNGVIRSLKLMGVWSTDMVITANIPLRLDGLPLAGARTPADPAVAVWWIDPKSRSMRTMACDAWLTPRDNLRAIGLALEAMRALERSQATQVFERAMQSFEARALPTGLPWFCAVLGLDRWPVNEAAVRSAYTARVKERHPDAGGSHDAFIELQRAKDAALLQVSP